MARLGTALGWPHYSAGWHATCTAGAPACAAGAAVALGLDPGRIATAIALAIPGAGGVQRAFGTDAKSLQAGFAVDAGIRAALLAAAGARADWSALEAWLALVGGDPGALDLAGRSRARRAGHQDLPLLVTRYSARSARSPNWRAKDSGSGRGAPHRGAHARGDRGPAHPPPARHRPAG